MIVPSHLPGGFHGFLPPGELFAVVPHNKRKTKMIIQETSGGELAPKNPDQNGMAAVRFIFESEILKDDNQPFRLTFQANCTMSDKGNLKPFLNGWGVDLVRTKSGLDVVASCVGKMAMINVVHKVKGESTYANVSTAMPSDSDLKPSGSFDKSDYMNYCLTQYQEKEEKKRKEKLNK